MPESSARRGDAGTPVRRTALVGWWRACERPGLGGFVIDHGPGIASVTWAAALVTLGGLAIAGLSVRLDGKRSARSIGAAPAVVLPCTRDN